MLDIVEEDQQNQIVSVEQANDFYQSAFLVSTNSAIYYPYNHGVRDAGWGCAWRAIQTLISNRNKHLPFQTLYSTYSRKQLLLEIIKKSKNTTQSTLSVLTSSKWAPEEIQQHWAEPFIGSLVCQHLNLPSSLLILNGYPKAYAPKEVFEKTITFKQLLSIIQSHIKSTTVMIDDGKYALSIIGFRQVDPETIEFLFADPHIRSNLGSREVGLYRKGFTLAGQGKGPDSRSQIQIKEALYNVYASLQFETKNWMICFMM